MDDGLCTICQDNLAQLIAIPCGHFYLCQDCYDSDPDAFSECSICKASVGNYYRMYNSTVQKEVARAQPVPDNESDLSSDESIVGNQKKELNVGKKKRRFFSKDTSNKKLEKKITRECMKIMDQKMEQMMNNFKILMKDEVSKSHKLINGMKASESMKIAMEKGGPYIQIEEARKKGLYEAWWKLPGDQHAHKFLKMLGDDGYHVSKNWQNSNKRYGYYYYIRWC